MGRRQGSRGWKGRGCPQPEAQDISTVIVIKAGGRRWKGKELGPYSNDDDVLDLVCHA